MAEYGSDISQLKKFLKSDSKKKSKKGSQSVDEESLSGQNTGIEEAINALEEKGEDKFQDLPSGNLIRNFSSILDSTGRKTKENSNMAKVVKAVEALNDKSFSSQISGVKAHKVRDEVYKKADEVIVTGTDYLDSVNPWTTSGKQRKALVNALMHQVQRLKNGFRFIFAGGTEGSFIKQCALEGIQNNGSESWVDLVIRASERAYVEQDSKEDIRYMSDAEKKALRESIMTEYNLTGEEADRLLDNRDEISATDMYFSGKAAVTPDMIRKLASQFNQKKEFKSLTSGTASGTKENESLAQHRKAAEDAKKYCEVHYKISFKTLDGAFGRVLCSMMDISGTDKALKNNARMYKYYMTSRYNEDGGYYWDLVSELLNTDFSILENRDPKYVLMHHNEIHDVCEMGTEVLQNVLSKMKEDTGVEPDEDTMHNIQAMASFLMDYTMYNAGVWDLLGSDGIDFFDLDRFDEYDSLLEASFGSMREGGNAGSGDRAGVNKGMDTRSNDYDALHTGTYANMETSQTMLGLSAVKQYKIATYKGSLRDLLRSEYGFKDMPGGPTRKRKLKKEDIKK